MDNAAIARMLAEMASICEIRDDNSFKIRALKNAAEAVEAHPHDLGTIARTAPAKLREVPGIGEGIAKKIVELVTTGRCAEHEELRAAYPTTLLDLLQLEGVGPKKVRLFHDVLGVSNMAQLEAVARAGKVRELPRVGAKAEEKLIHAIEAWKTRSGRFTLGQAEPVVARLAAMMREVPGVTRIEPAGSFRRRRDTVGDVDLLVVSSDPGPALERFAKAGEVLGRGETKCSIRLVNGLQADLRVLPAESFGAAMHYFTGSKAHNVAMRALAQRQGMTLNEYGLFEVNADGTTGRRVAGETEEEIFGALGLAWIPPELREDKGEIDLARERRLPRLVSPEDIRGDVHMHTTASDGRNSIEEMARAALALGRTYIAITDHSKALAVANGLDEARLRAQGEAIRAVEASLGGAIRIFRGCEVDILKDGSLDLDDPTLASLDVVVASIHSHFQLSREEQTARVLRAIESGKVDAIGHPTGRMLLRRDAYPLDMEAIMRAAAAKGVALEASSMPDRMDLHDHHCRMAKEHGVKVLIDTDAHETAELEQMRFGLASARRGGLTPEDVCNTRSSQDFLRHLHAGHR